MADDEIKIKLVWLVPHHRSETAHMYEDYLRTPHGPFLAVLSICGTRRDPSVRIPANLRKKRICSRCSRILENRERRATEYAEVLRKYAEPRRKK